ncbi:response regulator [Synechococcales cyanobacterium C]|uniref:Response regulator n=1 Tax=Petrachloros mirabilis ULC683 TaxID=2781853 RepID=A0A8K1ZWQ7_9CYAN|nr:response regulator [Petrachloros mirabilis]NCJ05502.1 response regulator [Petrachloros mirabilis ULC683]
MIDTLSDPITPVLASGLQGVPIVALQHYIRQQQSGRLSCLDPKDHSVGWRVYFSGGQIHFAESIMGQADRLSYLLQDVLPNLDLSPVQANTTAYDLLYQQLEARRLSWSDLRHLVARITQEALIQLLAVPKANLLFEPSVNLDPLLCSSSFWSLVLPIEALIQQWTAIRPEVSSPFRRPFIQDWDQFVHQGRYLLGDVWGMQPLTDALNQNHCLYQLACQLHLNAQDLAAMLHPLVKSGALGMEPYQTCPLPRRPTVICIDSSKLTRHWVRRLLEPLGYEVITLQQTQHALLAIQRHCPNLVILDTQILDPDNYQFCRALRQMPGFQNTPILLLSPAERLIDRIWIRLSGATAYASKPFHPKTLQSLVIKLVSTSD